jgi:hypothetical protein
MLVLAQAFIFYAIQAGLWIRIDFTPDQDPDIIFYLYPDPDPSKKDIEKSPIISNRNFKSSREKTLNSFYYLLPVFLTFPL